MKELNRIRLAAGLPIDPSIERTVTNESLTESDTSDNKAADKKALKVQKRCLERAIKYLKSSIDVLETVPAVDLDRTTHNIIRQLERVLGSDNDSGMEAHYENVCSKLRKMEASEELSKRREEEEEAYSDLEANINDTEINKDVNNDDFNYQDSDGGYSDDNVDDEGDETLSSLEQYISSLSDEQREVLQNVISILTDTVDASDDDKREAFESFTSIIDDDKLEEAMHYYSVNYGGYEEVDKPINVSNGSSSKDNVWKQNKAHTESPSQLKTLKDRDNSPQDKSGNDSNIKIKVPASIKKSLKTEIKLALDDADKLDVRDKDSAAFYHRLANAFNDILQYLENGTQYDIKQAQVYAQGLMGPMLHKLPKDVWKFLTNGGETRSLKSYMREIK